MPMRRPRIGRSARSGKPRRSCPANAIRPPSSRALRGSARMIAAARLDLPDPDSPTSPSTSPGATCSDSRSNTGRTEPATR